VLNFKLNYSHLTHCLIKESYITENFPKIPEVYENVGYPYNERYLGTGLITEPDNNRWKKRRALFNPGFHRQLDDDL
jgi:hypothetical protein